MIRDYWVWQARNVDVPWSLYIVKEYDKPQTFDNIVLDVTIYSEDIDNSDHMLSFLNWHFNDVDGYVDKIKGKIEKFSNFTDADYAQVSRAIWEILNDTRESKKF